MTRHDLEPDVAGRVKLAGGGRDSRLAAGVWPALDCLPSNPAGMTIGPRLWAKAVDLTFRRNLTTK
ncbi:hypothetical protein VSH64_09590 [Amycolatopsis rhabdoformis]|uniref:Uncharacterized protein n=1 Tax=Amycolatopsis rhabdoformis TaxID=1448059 RepID=A0ABZ1ID15_9PSEU|nr:hypothetical protein [Amycolatopsis rhabdoformis]WSE32354.1 hypothetical protein VSH64_09590 [Amycolatopsis rhabdoformis]